MNICQFYIILGNHGFVPKKDDNVYINASGVEDVNLIWKSIELSFQKKSREGIKISSEVIFLIPDNSYVKRANEIMDKLGINGRVEIRPIKKVQEEAVSQVKKEDIQKEVNNTELDLGIDKNTSDMKEDVSVNKEELKIEEKKEEKPDYSYKPDNVYRREIDIPISGGGTGRYNSGVTPTPVQSNNKVKSLVKKKPNAFVSLPVIIFIISFMLLVASLVMLFVLS